MQKGKITVYLQSLEKCIPAQRPTIIDNINTCLSKVVAHNAEIEQLFTEVPGAVSDNFELSEAFQAELNCALEYVAKIDAELAKYKEPAATPPQVDRSQPVAFDLKLPHISCDSFSGEDKDVLKFSEFLNKFNNLIGHRSNLSDSVKLSYLKGYLTGYASKVIDYLPICDGTC